ncbi:glycosyltransferase family 4 protein [Butyrivibrio sp. AE2032]|uniref:glycosyltransferase family 4 protein n=1 Tax=Butyrivibrio sp. AE2032 TaxID=1458463 RepID=UPI0009DDAD01|nr:glycosyltransferase family 4 protein [Butyrivibrio sp. AE2032]
MMMNILYIAYSCNPFAGSEDKIGWCVPFESSKTNKVVVITKEEQRAPITHYLKNHSVDNIEFYYVDIPRIYKKLFKGFLYSGRLNIWHRRALPIVKRICEEKHIDIIHQITPIEFRAIGDYGIIENVHFVCGPLGGGEFVPKGLSDYTMGHRFIEFIRFVLNHYYRKKLCNTNKLKRSDYVMFANKETYDFLGGDNCSGELVFDNGLREDEISELTKKDSCIFLSAGRMIYRKGYDFLLDVLMTIPESLKYEVRIVGDGPELERLRKRCANDPNLTKHVSFIGAIPYEEIEKEYIRASAFIMPSIRETTGTVLLEAMSKGLPVIALNKFGASTLFDETTGWLLDGDSKESYISSFGKAIIECITSPEKVEYRGQNARRRAEEYTWIEKNKKYQSIYNQILHN